MAAGANINVDLVRERRSFQAGYRPGVNNSARPLFEGEPFVNFADGVRCIGSGDGAFVEVPFFPALTYELPAGGTAGQVLTKTGPSRTQVVWSDPSDSPAAAKAINFRQRKFDLGDYGAPLNGDAKGAFDLALTALKNSAAGGTIVVGGAFSCSAGVAATIPAGKQFSLRGDTNGAALYFSGITGGAIDIRAGDYSVGLDMRDLSVYVDNSPNLGDLVFLRGGGDSACLTVENVRLKGSASAIPGHFLTLVNPADTVYKEITIDGRSGPYGPSDQRGAGIYTYGDKQLGASTTTGVTFLNCLINRVGTAILALGTSDGGSASHTIEGVTLDKCTLVGVGIGLDYRSPADIIPGMGVFGGHINASKICIALTKIAQMKIQDVLLYLDANYSPAAHIQTSGVCRDINIHHNTMAVIDTINSGLKTGVNSIILGGSTNACSVERNHFEMLTGDPCLLVDAGARYNGYGFNTKWRGGGSQFASDSGVGTYSFGSNRLFVDGDNAAAQSAPVIV